MKRRPPIVIALGVGAMIAVLLSLTFGWVGTLLLGMPDFMFATLVEGHEVSKFGPYIFFGNFIFYTTIIWIVQQLRRIDARSRRKS